MRTLALALVLALVGVLVAEAAMQPTATDRLVFLAVFGSMAVVTAAIGAIVTRIGLRFATLHRSVLFAAAAAVVIAAGVATSAAGLMFLSGHDLRVVLVALGVGVMLGGLLATSVARTIAADLQAVAGAIGRVAAGDLGARTGLKRRDEIGDLAAAVDRLAERLERAEAARGRAEEARNVMLAAVGHDLRTPLTAMRAAVEALQDGIASDPARYLTSVERDLDAMAAMVDDLFLLARLENEVLHVDPAPLDVAEIVDEVVEALAPVAERRGIGLRVRGVRPAVLQGGSNELGRALRNLVDNAIRHAPEHTQVTIEVGRSNGSVTVLVADPGPGFDFDVAPVAFDEFVRGDPARARDGGGAGLGLAIARRVVEAHGGSIWIDDGPGGRVAMALPTSGRSR